MSKKKRPTGILLSEASNISFNTVYLILFKSPEVHTQKQTK